jgi:hypothetical protein
VRGEIRTPPIDAVYRATLRGDSTRTRERAEGLASELLKGSFRIESGKSTLIATRKQVEGGWRGVRDILLIQGRPELAAQVARFLDAMPPPLSDKERMAAGLRQRARTPERQLAGGEARAVRIR